MAVVIFGFLAIMFYTACDAWGSIKQAVGPRYEDHSQTLNLHTMPGEPTSQEWGAIVEIHRQIENRQKGKLQ